MFRGYGRFVENSVRYESHCRTNAIMRSRLTGQDALGREVNRLSSSSGLHSLDDLALEVGDLIG